MANPKHLAFDIEFKRPSNALSLWPLVFTLLPVVLGGTFYWFVPATRNGFFAVIWLLFFLTGLGLVVHSFSQTTGTIRIVVKSDHLEITENPGRSRQIPVTNIKQIMPHQKLDDYGDETNLGSVAIITKDDKIVRIPENRVFFVPHLHATNLAKNMLRSLRGQDLIDMPEEVEEVPPTEPEGPPSGPPR